MINSSRLPDDSVNVAKENHLLLFAKLLVALFVGLLVIFISIDYIVEKSVDMLTPAQERKIMQSLFVDLDIPARDNAYLNRIAKRLLSCSRLSFEPKVFAVNSSKVNAFAMPNGNIYITKGMLKSVKNENEIAFVIGHEIGHFRHRDHLKGLGITLFRGFISLFLGDVFGNSLLAVDFTKLQYSKLAEMSADIFALEVMKCSYGTTEGAENLFLRIGDRETAGHFFSTHPSFENRAKIIRDWGVRHKSLNGKIVPLEENLSAVFVIYKKKSKKKGTK